MNININRVLVTVTAPAENIEEIREAICSAGAGIIGNYTNCTVSSKCIGTFKPSEEAKPYIGEINNLEFVEEEKLQFVCDINIAKKVINRLREVHPYEGPAINIIPLIDEQDL